MVGTVMHAPADVALNLVCYFHALSINVFIVCVLFLPYLKTINWLKRLIISFLHLLHYIHCIQIYCSTKQFLRVWYFLKHGFTYNQQNLHSYWMWLLFPWEEHIQQSLRGFVICSFWGIKAGKFPSIASAMFTTTSWHPCIPHTKNIPPMRQKSVTGLQKGCTNLPQMAKQVTSVIQLIRAIYLCCMEVCVSNTVTVALKR
jgi:hypothetical protein